MEKQSLVEHIRRFVELNENEILVLNTHIRTIRLNRKDYLLKEGQVCNSLFFVEQGCLRMFYINKKLSEQITQFALEGWWLADHFSFMDNIPSEYYIQTIEKSTILAIDHSQFDNLLQEIPQLDRYFRIIMQKAVASAQHRSRLEFEMSKEEFYTHFSTSFPEFIQRVPQYMIASYLGLSPEYLSELRKKK